MADDSTMLRKVLLLGPQTPNGALWRAMLSTTYSRGAKPATAKSYGLRVLLQTADPAKLNPQTAWASGGHEDVDFHVPQLIQLAAGGGSRDDKDLPSDWLALGSSRAYLLQPVQRPPDIGFGLPVAVPVFTPAGPGEAAWPRPPLEQQGSQTWGEIALPTLRLADGRIRLNVSGQPGGSGDILPSWLDIPNRKAFGSLDIAVSSEQTLTMDLVPNGIEFEARIANPFIAFMPSGSALLMWVRLRLVSLIGPEGAQTLALDLIGPAAQEPDLMAPLRAAMAAMAASLRQAADLSQMSPLALRVNLTGAVPALRWLLNGTTLPDGGRTVDLPLESIRAAVMTGRITGGALASTAEIAASRVVVSRNMAGSADTTRLTVSAQPQAGTPQPPESEPKARIDWVPAHLGGFSFALSSPVGSFKLGIDRAGLEERLTSLYAAAHVLPTGAKRAPYFYLLIEGGMAQLPLSIGVLPATFDSARGPRPSQIQRGAIEGRIHIDMEPRDPRAPVKRQVDIESCTGLDAVASWAGKSLTSVTVTVTAPTGALSGFLWAAEASPSQFEVVPTLRGGPAATRDLPLLLGADPDPLLQVECANFSARQDSFTLTLSGPGPAPEPAATSGDVPAPATLWSAHPRLPLISAIAMTRTAESAVMPSLSRGLVPYVLAGTRAYSLPDGTLTNGWRLPLTLDLSTARPAFDFAKAQTDGLLAPSGWPWPAPPPAAGRPTQWPTAPAVPLVLPTLPGVEFMPSSPNGHAGLGLATALRFDLPGLDEYFAAVVPRRAPEASEDGTETAIRSGPTSLEPEALRESWQAAAERLALTRTELARATPWIIPGTGSGTGPKYAIDGLLEPFQWTVQCSFAEGAQVDKVQLPFGTFSITQAGGSDQPLPLSGAKALAGLKGWLALTGSDLSWSANEPTSATDRVAIAGFAVPARRTGEAWMDTRGIATAAMPWKSTSPPPPITGGGRIFLRAAGPTPGLMLATLTQPIPLQIDGQPVQLWFANLPFEGDRFDGSANPLEASPGPNERLFDRETISRSRFEWRLFAGNGPERFDLPLGPLRLRPLRLWEVQLADAGTDEKSVISVKVLGRVLAASAGETDGPYGEDSADAVGNIVALTFSGNNLALTSITRQAVSLDTDHRLTLITPVTADVSFRLSPLTGWVQDRDEARLPLELRLWLGLAGGKVTFTQAAVRGWLFGVAVDLPGQAVVDADLGLNVTLRDTGGDGDLRLSRLTLKWTPCVPGSEELSGEAKLVVPVSGGSDGPMLEMVQLALGRSLSWLGLELKTGARTTTVIDHKRGLILCQRSEDEPEADGILFCGLPLKAPQVTGVIAVALCPGKASTPSWMVTAGTVRLRAQTSQTSQGFTRVRHILTRSCVDAPWSSRLSLDGQITATSRISWPIYAWSPPASDTPDRLDSVQLAATGMTMTFGTPSLTLAHEVTLILRDHELPPTHLEWVEPAGETRGSWQLSRAWTVLALVKHTLTDTAKSDQMPTPRLSWRTLDHVAIDHLPRLVKTAGEAPTDYALLPRYRNEYQKAGGSSSINPHVKHPGIVERPFANAGFPTADMAELLLGLGSGATKDSLRDHLVMSGAGIARVRIGARPDPTGGDASVLLSLPWLVGVDTPALPVGLAFAQDGGGTFEVSDVDLAVSAPLPAGGTARRVTLPFPNARSIADCIRRALDLPADANLPPLTPVDQSITRAIAEPLPDIAKRPLWLHALQAVARLWPLAAKAPGCVEERVADLVVSGRSDGRSALLAFADPEQPPQEPGPQARIFVLSRDGLLELVREGTIATRLDWGQLPQIAHSATPAALAVVGGLVELIDGARSDFETLWDALRLPPADDFGGTARPLRRQQDVLHPSAALGWPSGAKIAELALLAPGLGPEGVLQDDPADPELASGLAGRVRTHSFAARADASNGAEGGVFLGFGLRPIFTRPALPILPGAPALHLSAAPPRRRVPMARDLDAELTRMSAPGGMQAQPSLAHALVPPHVEVMTMGARPGVLYLHRTDAAMALTGDIASAPDAFGRPAGAGPAVVSHGRAPRSGPYPRDNDTATTRRTVVGADDRDGAALRPFRWLRGPAALLRQRQPGTDPGTVILRVIEPDLGRIAAGWDGRLTVSATMPGQPNADPQTIRAALAAHLKPDGTTAFTALDARLVVGSAAFAFAPLALAGPTPSATGPLSLDLRMPPPALAAAQAALAAANPDTRLVVMMGDSGLAVSALTPVARILRFPLLLTTTERATLPVDMGTLLFADPAYDRTLSGPTASTLVRTADNTAWLAATDRTGYDLSTPILFTAGQLSDGLFTADPQVNKVAFAIQRAASERTDAPPRREEIQLAAGATRTDVKVWYPMAIQTAYRIVLTGFVGLADLTPVAFRPGDQLVLAFSLNKEKATCEIVVSILDQAILPPAEAVYSLVVLQGCSTGTGTDVRAQVPLHACAPLPQDVDHPHLLEDLAGGIVRRRAIFQWTHPLEAPRPPIATPPALPDLKAALLKIDRTGAGQLPDMLADLQRLEE